MSRRRAPSAGSSQSETPQSGIGPALIGSSIVSGGSGGGGALFGACAKDNDSLFCKVVRAGAALQAVLYIIFALFLVFAFAVFVRHGGLRKIARMAKDYAK